MIANLYDSTEKISKKFAFNLKFVDQSYQLLSERSLILSIWSKLSKPFPDVFRKKAFFLI